VLSDYPAPVRFLPLGLHIPEDDPDRKPVSLTGLPRGRCELPNETELTLLSPGDIFLLYTDGVYDGSDKEERRKLEDVMREQYRQSAKEICNALMDYAVKRDDHLCQIGEQDRIDDKTVFLIKRN